jgi:xanthine/uracil permease
MGIITTFIVMLIGILLAPVLANGVATTSNSYGINGTANALLAGVVTTIYLVLVIFAGAKELGAI